MTEPIKIINKKDCKKNPNQREVWDSIAAPWKTYVVKKIPIVVEFLKNKKGRILDLGCGNGRNFIKQDDVKYYGIDFSKGQIEHAKRAVEREKIDAELFCMKIEKLSFKDNFFDYGLFMATLHCLETEKERENSLREFYRVLKKNAEGLISVWDSEDKRFKGFDKEIYMSWKEDGIPYMRYYYLYSHKELINLLRKIGFEVLEIYKKREHDRFSKKNFILRIKKV